MKTRLFLLIPALLTGIALAEMGKPEDIPNAGRIRIDGRLDDWRNAEWTPLTQTFEGNPVNISDAQWSIQWNDDPALYIAVRYNDANIVLQDGYVNSNAQDCVEIFVRGDNGSEPLDYSKDQSSAQHYIFGLARDRVTAWKKLAGIDPFPLHNPAKVSVVLTGSNLVYEIMVPVYDKFDVKSRQKSETTDMPDAMEIGIDIIIVDTGATGYAGRKSENTMEDKAHKADHIALHTIEDYDE